MRLIHAFHIEDVTAIDYVTNQERICGNSHKNNPKPTVSQFVSVVRDWNGIFPVLFNCLQCINYTFIKILQVGASRR